MQYHQSAPAHTERPVTRPRDSFDFVMQVSLAVLCIVGLLGLACVGRFWRFQQRLAQWEPRRIPPDPRKKAQVFDGDSRK